jgi:hypothetical protein
MILRLFKHLFWLAAWGVWLWLGFGLYRELPRDVGPVVGKLPLEGEADHLLGILEGDDLALTMSVKPAYGGNVQFDTWEIVGRRKRHSFVGPTLWFGSNSSIRHGVAIGPARGDDKSAKESMQVLDLRTGEWKKLGPKTWNHLGVHPTRPWAAFADNGDRKSPAKLFVIDFRTGERVFEWTASSDPKRKLFLRECQFLDGDEFLINASDPRSVFIHLSRTRGELARMTIDRPRFSATGPIRNGRVALLGLVGDEGVVEVVEFPTGRTIFSSASLPAEIKAATKDDWMSPANLSTQGRGLFTWGSKLFSVDCSGRSRASTTICRAIRRRTRSSSMSDGGSCSIASAFRCKSTPPPSATWRPARFCIVTAGLAASAPSATTADSPWIASAPCTKCRFA